VRRTLRSRCPAPLHNLLHTRVHKILCIVTSVMVPQRDLSHVVFWGLQSSVFAECTLSLVETTPRGAKVVCPLGPTSGGLTPPIHFWGPPWGCFSAVKIYGEPVQSPCGLSVETSSPQWGQRLATVPKRCHKIGLKASLSDPCASLWAAVAKKSALCGNIMYHVLTSSFVLCFSPSKWTRECNVHQKLSF
jgi:hypothetical protein